jgi:DNA-binding transcriptional MerR regulator
MLYTVKDFARLADVTVKTLHHYHKIGLLVPCKISEAGYRLYGQEELERLQQIRFYRELDFSLSDIQKAMSDGSKRVKILSDQRKLLTLRLKRTERLIKTLDASIAHTKRGEIMEEREMFKGFDEKEWKQALAEQSEYLNERYGYNMLEESTIQPDKLNTMAAEVTQYLNALAQALREGIYYKNESVKKLVSDHVAFLNNNGHAVDPESFLKQTRFLVEDDFHRKMLEGLQTGLSYFLLATAENFATS